MHTALAILLKSKKPLPVTVIAQAIAKMVMRAKAILITFRMTPFFMQSYSFIKFRLVCPLESKSFTPRRKLLMPDVYIPRASRYSGFELFHLILFVSSLYLEIVKHLFKGF